MNLVAGATHEDRATHRRALALVPSRLDRGTPEALAFQARVASLDYTLLALRVVRKEPMARLTAAARMLGVASPVLAVRLAMLPILRRYIVFGEVPR